MKLPSLKPKTMVALAVVSIAVLTYFATASMREISAAKSAVKSRLKDPESVQYRDLQTYYPDTVCGLVNARNSMGGYTGFSPFIYTKSDDDVDFSPSSEKVSYYCSDQPKQAAKIIGEFNDAIRR